jgi:demethylmenaquinone methyltransferase/2-methoxy-6-polyprenyl-1,4-benzoquinol methylase
VAGIDELDELLSEQMAYYRAKAPEYEAGALELPGGEEIEEALDSFGPKGDVLELACGTGLWTRQLLRHARSVTAIDASAEMLAIASRRLADDRRVRLVEADLFRWRPERRYDVVFFGFWISHVPLERFDSFWSTVADCLTPRGRVFFADDAYRTPEELVGGESSQTIRRRLGDGSLFRVVKVPHTASGLERRLAELGWRIEVHQTSGPFYWGSGSRG